MADDTPAGAGRPSGRGGDPGAEDARHSADAAPAREPTADLRLTPPTPLPAEAAPPDAGLAELEPELRAPPPRPNVWIRPAGNPLTASELRLLQHGRPVRARVVTAERGADAGPEAGLWFRVRYVYRLEGRVRQGSWSGTFDGLHLAHGAPQLHTWLSSTLVEGGELTVLIPPGGGQPVLYGLLQVFVRRTLKEAVGALQRCPAEAVDARAAEALKLALGPFGKVGRDWEVYYDLLGRVGLYDAEQGVVRDWSESYEVVRTAWRRGVDPAAVDALSDFCARYLPGVWAAR